MAAGLPRWPSGDGEAEPSCRHGTSPGPADPSRHATLKREILPDLDYSPTKTRPQRAMCRLLGSRRRA